jgi:hypothetical protein
VVCIITSMPRTHGVFIPGGPQPDISQFVNGAYVACIWPTRDYHQTVCRLEDLGWEVRDSIKVYLYETSYQVALLRKPHSGRVIDNLRIHGAGALNIEDNRVGNIIQDTSKNSRKASSHQATIYKSGLKEDFEGRITEGRWPSNLLIDDAAAEELDRQMPIAGALFNAERKVTTSGGTGNSWTTQGVAAGKDNGYLDAPSGASKFYARVNSMSELSELLTKLIAPPETE